MHIGRIPAPHPAASGLIPAFPKISSEEKITDVTEVYQQCCLEESGQPLENVDRTHLDLAGGKPVLKIFLRDQVYTGI